MDKKMALVSMLMVVPSTFLFVLAYFTFFRKNEKQKILHRTPPGYKGLPFFGESFSFLKTYSQNSVGEFIQHRLARFGNIFSTNIFGSPSVISANSKFMHRLVMNNDVLFAHGITPSVKKIVGENSLGLAVGDVHKHMRSTVLNFLSGERLRTIFFQDTYSLASEVISLWKDVDVISIKDEAFKFSLCIMAKRLLSMRGPDIETLEAKYDSVTKAFKTYPFDIPGTRFRKGIQARKYIISMFKKEMKARNGKTGHENAEYSDDLLGFLLKNTDYSEDKICDFLLGLLFAGHDTIARGICLLIYYLESCPKAVAKLREEHLEVMKLKQQERSKIAWLDFKSMEFTRCVINETLRLGNISRFILRSASTDVEFEDYVIPKGCRVLVHIGSTHLDPSVFEHPTQFNPWRWLTSSGVRSYESFMPFSKGVRRCPGDELSKMELVVFLHHILIKYDWKLAEPDDPIVTPLTEFPKGLPIKLTAISGDLDVRS